MNDETRLACALNDLIAELSDVPESGVVVSKVMAQNFRTVFIAMKQTMDQELQAVGAR